ncbi:MAG: hypothetical protein MIO90_02065 [Methanomassiliicoccales archaeon]|nr:hypothetical protein [Methanomassiliicoccales archaeon]
MEDPSPKKMKFSQFGAIAAFALVIVIVTAFIMYDPVGNDENDIDKPLVMEVGDCLNFTLSMGQMHQTMNYTVMEVTETSYIMNVVTISPFAPPMSFEQEWPKNATMGSDFDFNDPPAGMTVQDHGFVDVDTVWGSMSARHYKVSYEQGSTQVTMQFWVWKNVVLRSEGGSGGMSLVIELTNSNIPEITG